MLPPLEILYYIDSLFTLSKLIRRISKDRYVNIPPTRTLPSVVPVDAAYERAAATEVFVFAAVVAALFISVLGSLAILCGDYTATRRCALKSGLCFVLFCIYASLSMYCGVAPVVLSSLAEVGPGFITFSKDFFDFYAEVATEVISYPYARKVLSYIGAFALGVVIRSWRSKSTSLLQCSAAVQVDSVARSVVDNSIQTQAEVAITGSNDDNAVVSEETPHVVAECDPLPVNPPPSPPLTPDADPTPTETQALANETSDELEYWPPSPRHQTQPSAERHVIPNGPIPGPSALSREAIARNVLPSEFINTVDTVENNALSENVTQGFDGNSASRPTPIIRSNNLFPEAPSSPPGLVVPPLRPLPQHDVSAYGRDEPIRLPPILGPPSASQDDMVRPTLPNDILRNALPVIPNDRRASGVFPRDQGIAPIFPDVPRPFQFQPSLGAFGPSAISPSFGIPEESQVFGQRQRQHRLPGNLESLAENDPSVTNSGNNETDLFNRYINFDSDEDAEGEDELESEDVEVIPQPAPDMVARPPNAAQFASSHRQIGINISSTFDFSFAIPGNNSNQPHLAPQLAVRDVNAERADRAAGMMNQRGSRHLNPLPRRARLNELAGSGNATGNVPVPILNSDARLSRYAQLQLLNQGAFSEVWQARDTAMNRVVALKIFKLSTVSPETAQREVQMYQHMESHRGGRDRRIPILFDAIISPQTCVLALEAFRCSMHDVFGLLKSHNATFAAAQLRQVTSVLTHTVAWLHDISLIHCDIKPSNIAVSFNDERISRDWDGSRKLELSGLRMALIDFNVACLSSENLDKTLTTGTPYYSSPETQLKQYWSLPRDVWASGLTLYELAFVQFAFPMQTQTEEWTKECAPRHLQCINAALGPAPENLLRRVESEVCMNPDRQQLLAAFRGETLLDSETYQYARSTRANLQPVEEDLFRDLISAMLRIDPDTRITMKDALRHPYITS